LIAPSQLSTFEHDGFILVKDFLSRDECSKLLAELECAIQEDKSANPDVFDAGMVHNCFSRGSHLLRHLESSELRAATDALLCKHAIIYSYQSSSLPPGRNNFGSRIHVDCPRFIPGYRTNLGYILALNDFTAENGATYVLPGSHKAIDPPSNENFYARAKQLECKVGDAIFFDARLWHAAGTNSSNEWRHGLTINFCRPYMRTRFDFPRLIKKQHIELRINTSAMKFLGFDVRMPSTLEEFYRPADQRLYKPGQE
jgi:ectoine hydroxylase-related dioxygenase (phytanoyl-CoA dioxygenase family)